VIFASHHSRRYVTLTHISGEVKRVILGDKHVSDDDEEEDQDSWHDELATPDVQIADFGNACWVDKHFTDDIQTTQYRYCLLVVCDLAFYCIVLYCIVLYRVVLYCIVLYCIAVYRILHVAVYCIAVVS